MFGAVAISVVVIEKPKIDPDQTIGKKKIGMFQICHIVSGFSQT